MVEWMHIPFEVVLVLVSITLSFYSLTIANKFKGSVGRDLILASVFRIFSFTSLLFGVAYIFDIGWDLLGAQYIESELFHYILDFSFMVALFYAVHKLYRALTKLQT